ncbi:MAG: helix-turn-helix transcriptional regulator [Ferruginibacter sp.]
MTIGELIIMLRKQLKMSQDDLAKKIGTSAPIIGRYEHNEIKPSIEVAPKIADEFGVTVDFLPGNSDKMVMDKKLMQRTEDIEALPVEEKGKVYYFIDMALSHHKAKKLLTKQNIIAPHRALSFLYFLFCYSTKLLVRSRSLPALHTQQRRTAGFGLIKPTSTEAKKIKPWLLN